MSKSGVYLVSSKPSDGYDNQAFTNPDAKVTYSPANGVEMTTDQTHRAPPERPYRGMGKEDLLHFSSQPLWRRLRMACVSIIVLGWIALIITVVALVLAYPKCRDPASREWWQNEVVYRVYLPSFKDSGNDGIGDLKGLESKLDYIKDLGASVISLSPFYKVADNPGSAEFKDGDDMAIIDHTDVDQKYGTLADFRSLMTAAHEKDMYVVVDFVPGVTSKEHPWFKNSTDSSSAQRNFYIWTNTTNNWVSKYNGSAWAMDTARGESYLHQFRSDTPSLNLRSAMVQDELKSILKFWLAEGVDGFNVRDAGYLYVDYDMRDESLRPGATQGSSNYEDYDHKYTTNQEEVYGILDYWRALLRSGNNTGKLLMTGLEGVLPAARLYGECSQTGVQLPLSTGSVDIPTPCDGECVRRFVDTWMELAAYGDRWSSWVTGYEGIPRMTSRHNASFIEPYIVLTMLLPGTPVLYYGDEIKMADVTTPGAPGTREQPMRSPMQWENATDVGFCNSSCTPWMKVGNSSDRNVESGSGLSSLIKELAALRSEPSFRVGDYVPGIRDGAVFSFVREFDGETGYLVAINFGPNTESRDFTSAHSTVQSDVIVTLSHASEYAVEDEVEADGLTVGPYGAVVVSWDYMAKEL